MSHNPKVPVKRVALNLNHKPVSTIIAEVKNFVIKMTGNTNFPTPSPALSVITAGVNQVEAHYNDTKSRVLGAASLMHAELKSLKSELKTLASYVEAEANKTPDQAEAIILSSGMSVFKSAVRTPKTFTAKAGKLPGTVILDNKAEPKSIYVYQMSTDPTNPASWMEIYHGMKVKFTKSGLTVGTTVHFRTAVLDKDGQGVFGSPISYVVV